MSNRIRWQNHWHVVRQSWTFFQNDFAGRIATRVMQTGPAMRESVVAMITGVWYILVYGTSALILLARGRSPAGAAVVLWFVGYLVLLRIFVPRMRDRSKEMSETRSMLTGRIVDSYTNILTVKLFARARDEDDYVRDAVDEHTGAFYALAAAEHAVRPAACRRSTPADRRHRRARDLSVDARHDRGRHGRDGAAARLADRQHVRLGRLAGHRHLREYRRGAGRHDDDRAADRAHRPAGRAGARRDARRDPFEDVRFGYGRDTARATVRSRRHRRLTLTVKPGEKVGLVGRSGAGKSTLVNLLLRFFDLEGGRILIDGQDIAAVTQESLRAADLAW